MKGKRVFVSGGAGVIGLELIRKLVAIKAVVMVGDLKPRPKIFVPEVIYRQGDLNNLTQRELDEFLPEVFIHLAATFERSEESFDFWQENIAHNVGLSSHLLYLASRTPSLKRIVYASSYLIYDQRTYQFSEPQRHCEPLCEDSRVFPRNLTGMAKLSAEAELKFLDKNLGDRLAVVSARIFRGYGCNSRDVISRWVRALLRGEQISVFRDGGIFDYIYAGDSAEGLLRLAGNYDVIGAVNLGSGRSRAVREVVEILESHFPDMAVRYENSDLLYEASQADMNVFEEKVGWLPEYDIEDGIAKIIDYEREQLLISDSGVDSFNILITSSGGKVPMMHAVQDALNKSALAGSVFVSDLSENVLTSAMSEHFVKLPETRSSNWNLIEDVLIANDVKLVIPSRDGELIFWSRNRERLQQLGVRVLVSKEDSLTKCIDKLNFSLLEPVSGLEIIPSSRESNEIQSDSYVVKERFGAGSKSIGIGLSYDEACLFAESLTDPIFQPYIAGDEISVDAWIDRNGAVKGIVMRLRSVVVSGESQITETFRDPHVESVITAFLNTLDLEGPVVLQAFLASNGEVKVIECNPRFGGASTAGIAVGLDSFYWSIVETAYGSVSSYPFVRSTMQVRQVRAPSDTHVFRSHF